MALTCYCHNEKGEFCPEPPAWGVNISEHEVFLCERCYQNAKAGKFEPQFKLLAAVPLSIFKT